MTPSSAPAAPAPRRSGKRSGVKEHATLRDHTELMAFLARGMVEVRPKAIMQARYIHKYI